MKQRSSWYVFLFLLFATAGFAQTAPAPANAAKPADKSATKAPDYSQEPFVVEYLRSNIRFEPDGTGVKRTETRIRLQSEAAVQALGQLVLPYNSEFEKLTITGRVVKADGTTVTIPESSVQDLSSPVSRVAPMYSDQRQKHVIVPSLRPGDTLEYQTEYTQFAAMAPNNFWASYDFNKNFIVLDEQLTVDVPAAKYVNVKSRDEFKPETSEKKGRKIYTWNTSHLEREDDSADKKDNKKKKKKKDEDSFPDVQVSTFKTWNEVGAWYASLEKDRLVPSDAIKIKAADLTAGFAGDLDKLQAIYTYVAENYRYVSLSLGAGRYQPHAASEVFANQYGDCKDKHTLLASMASVIGLHAYAALTSTNHKVDDTFPSPSQFNHVVTYVSVDKDAVWLDTTADLAPFRLLMPQVRGKNALVVGVDGKSEIKQISDVVVVPGLEIVDIKGTVNELGTLDADVKLIVRGDAEVMGRLTVRAIPQAKWKDFISYMAKAAGIEGEVSEIKFSDVLDLQKPLEYDFHINKLNYFNRFAKEPRLVLPLGKVDFRDPDEPEGDKPMDMNIGRKEYHVQLKLPKEFAVQLPLPVKVDRDFAHYESSYSTGDLTVTAQRTLDIKLGKVPAVRYGEVQAFHRTIAAESRQELTINIDKKAAGEEASDVKADELLRSAYAAFESGDYQASIDLIERALKKEPTHKSAYNDLGRAYRALGKDDKAEEAFKKAIEINPFSPYAYNNLGLLYSTERRYDEAQKAFEKQIEVDPLDKWAHSNLGQMLNQEKKFAEGEAELEKANAITPDNVAVLSALGNAQLNLGKTEKAQASFAKAISLSPTPVSWNNVAYMLAEHKSNLDLAQQYAESAVATVSAQLRNVQLSDLKIQQLRSVEFLAMCWDTLGWVQFQKGNLLVAEKFLSAAWNLAQRATVGDHLGQLYEKTGNRDKAIEYYALALASLHPEAETRSRLAKLVGEDKIDALISRSREQLEQSRTFPVPSVKGDGSADFYVSISPTSKVSEVRYIRGDEKLKPLGDSLKQIDFGSEFPEDTDTRVVRRGTLSCSGVTAAATVVKQASSKDKSKPESGKEATAGACKFVLMTPETVRTTD